MANSGEENMLDCLETENIDYHNLMLERNNLQKLYNIKKETSVMLNKQVEHLRIKCQDQKNTINDLLVQEEQYSLLENENCALLKENKELKEKLLEAEKERECSLNLQTQKDTIEREHKKKVEKLQEGVDTMELVYTSLNERHERTVKEFEEELKELEKTKTELTNQVIMLKEVQVFTTYYEGPKYKEFDRLLDHVITNVISCGTQPRCQVTGRDLLQLYGKVRRIFSEIESDLQFTKRQFQVDDNLLEELLG